MVHKNKYFRVKRKQSVGGAVEYVVYGYDNKIEFLLGIGSEYDKSNPTLSSAIDQIKNIYRYSLKKIETVYRTNPKKMEADLNQKE